MTMLVLRALTGELRGQEFAATGATHWVLGRSRSCTLRLGGDSTVSRFHCLIEVDRKGVWVQDLGSLNGTHVNGERLGNPPVHGLGEEGTVVHSQRLALSDGDELRICNIVFAVCLRETPSIRDAARKASDSHEWDFSQGA